MNRLIVFTKYPTAGKVKTRLIPAVGAEKAKDIHQRLVAGTLAVVEQFVSRAEDEFEVEVCFTGAGHQQMHSWLGDNRQVSPQAAGNLGDRMHAAFTEAFAGAAEKCVLIGTDCAELNPHCLKMAFDLLTDNDLVLGPAMDGGYYAIGLKKSCPGIFADMPWGTDTVLTRTNEAAARLGLQTAMLPFLHDIDRPEDLQYLQNIPSVSDRVDYSIIIPALNEEHTITDTLGSIACSKDLEVIVVDGGSSDRTIEVAKDGGVTVISGPRGRARQMNYGARFSRGKYLLFLHADTQLPAGFTTEITRVLNRENTVAGAFRLRVDDPRWAMRWLEWLVSVRSGVFGLPYGDQAIFITSERFVQTGGFPDLPIMEDFEYMRQLRRRGKISQAGSSVRTSNRRWRHLGLLTTTLINQGVVIGFFLGVRPERLRRWYRRAGRLIKP